MRARKLHSVRLDDRESSIRLLSLMSRLLSLRGINVVTESLSELVKEVNILGEVRAASFRHQLIRAGL